MEIRNYKPGHVGFSYDFEKDGGAIGAFPTGVFVHAFYALPINTNVIDAVMVPADPGSPPAITITLEPSGAIVGFINPVGPVHTVTTFSSGYVRSPVTQLMVMNIISTGGAPPGLAGGAFTYFAPLYTFDNIIE